MPKLPPREKYIPPFITYDALRAAADGNPEDLAAPTVAPTDPSTADAANPKES